jgi:hypothetical protein
MHILHIYTHKHNSYTRTRTVHIHTLTHTHTYTHTHPPPGSETLLSCQKRPTHVSKETYTCVKRDLRMCQKRPGSAPATP